MPFVHIILNNSAGTVSDGDGRFAVKVNTSDTLTLSFVGYLNYSYIVTADSGVVEEEFYLQQESIYLKNVNVTPLPKDISEFKQAFRELELKAPDSLDAQQNINTANYIFNANPYYRTTLDAEGNREIWQRGNEALNPRGGNIKGLLKFLRRRVQGKPLKGTYKDYKDTMKEKGKGN